MKTKEARAREIQSSIRHIFNTEWNPIEASSSFSGDDEYDSYIGPIYNLLRSGASIEAIAEKLLEIEEKEMGLSGVDISDLKIVAEKLVELDVSLGGEESV